MRRRSNVNRKRSNSRRGSSVKRRSNVNRGRLNSRRRLNSRSGSTVNRRRSNVSRRRSNVNRKRLNSRGRLNSRRGSTVNRRKTPRKTKTFKSESKNNSISMIISPDTDFDVKKIKSMIHTTILKKGTKLYRTQPSKCDSLKLMKCEDTGKKGIYFGTNIYTPIGMLIEYNKPMKLCEYELKQDVLCYNGKYIFRYLEPERYFKTMDDLLNGKFIFNVSPSQSTNHIDGGVKGAEDYLLPIDPTFDVFHSGKAEKFWETLKDSEVFLTDTKLVKCLSEKEMTVKEAKDIIAELKKKI